MMLKVPRNRRVRSLTPGLSAVLLAGCAFALVFGAPTRPLAQSAPLHLNPMIQKLAEGKTVYGISTNDLSVSNAREIARAPVDWVYVDQENTPMDLPALSLFVMGMTDKAAVHRKGLQPNVAVMARFPPEADQSQWIVKQALGMGLHGILFNGVDTPEQALFAVRSMRLPQRKDSKYPEPTGIRGASSPLAEWIWGVDGDEYFRRADVWPLNPQGDLMAMLMIESVEAVDNIDAIASVPGVGSLFVASGGDLSASLGVPRGAPEVEAAFQRVLKACQAHKVACAISSNSPNDVVRRVKEGWQIIRSNVNAVVGARAILEKQ